MRIYVRIRHFQRLEFDWISSFFAANNCIVYIRFGIVFGVSCECGHSCICGRFNNIFQFCFSMKMYLPIELRTLYPSILVQVTWCHFYLLLMKFAWLNLPFPNAIPITSISMTIQCTHVYTQTTLAFHDVKCAVDTGHRMLIEMICALFYCDSHHTNWICSNLNWKLMMSII